MASAHCCAGSLGRNHNLRRVRGSTEERSEMNILDIIKPIKLLAGSHADTGQTGQGCFLNVIAYLNGDAQITDQSPCVCVTVRRMAIALNDQGNDEQRQRLLPFVMRAMGSATEDKAVLEARTRRLRQYGAECQEIINAWRAEMKAANANAYADAIAYASAIANAYADAIASANAYADANAYAYAIANAYAYAIAYASANAYADAYANANAYADKKQWVNGKRDELKAKLFDAGIRYLDDALPQADVPTQKTIDRAAQLTELCRKSGACV